MFCIGRAICTELQRMVELLEAECIGHLGIGQCKAAGDGRADWQVAVGADGTLVGQPACETRFIACHDLDEAQRRGPDDAGLGAGQGRENRVPRRSGFEHRQHRARGFARPAVGF